MDDLGSFFDQNIIPQMDRTDQRLTRVEDRLEQLDRKMDVVSAKVCLMTVI